MVLNILFSSGGKVYFDMGWLVSMITLSSFLNYEGVLHNLHIFGHVDGDRRFLVPLDKLVKLDALLVDGAVDVSEGRSAKNGDSFHYYLQVGKWVLLFFEARSSFDSLAACYVLK